MATDKLNEFGGYEKARALFDLVVVDMQEVGRADEARRLVSQQIATADSICANMEEGSGRWSTSEFVQDLVISRGSWVEVKGRDQRLHRWLPPAKIEDRVQRCDEIIAILTAPIRKLKARC
jgi:four helix bundle protein